MDVGGQRIGKWTRSQARMDVYGRPRSCWLGTFNPLVLGSSPSGVTPKTAGNTAETGGRTPSTRARWPRLPQSIPQPGNRLRAQAGCPGWAPRRAALAGFASQEQRTAAPLLFAPGLPVRTARLRGR